MSQRVLTDSKCSLSLGLGTSGQPVRGNKVGILVDQLEDSDESLAVADNQVVRPGVQANGGQFQGLGTSVALFPLETKGLVEAFSNINVRESPAVAVVPPKMDGKVVRASHKLLVVSRLRPSLTWQQFLTQKSAPERSLVIQVRKTTRS